MPLSWNEIKSRAAAFIKEWENESNEDAEAKSFWDDFFQIFDVKRRRLASFEHHVKKLNNKDGFIDLFWPGTLIVEHKSKGKSLDKAHGQVMDYFPGLIDKELPKHILVSDFANFRLYDLDENKQIEFPLTKLLEHITEFGFIANYPKRTIYKEQDPVNIEAAELMGQLHDKLKAIGYTGHELRLYLVRLLFCLFADDSNIFDRGIFNEYIELKTAPDGSDLARAIAELFQVLNTPELKRFKNLDESLAAFPYVNGKLFDESLPLASFDSSMRKIILDCCKLDWHKISPAIFGSLFQSVMDEKARRNLGAHYTSEKNILKLIKPLFLDELWDEFKKVQNSKAQLHKLHDKISSLRFLDPACGCGNFLIIAYRELRLLEIEIIKRLLKLQGYREEVLREAKMDADYLVKCNVDQFYGIEYEEFPSQIARTAMWLMDHQMNMRVTETFGEYYVRLPLQKAATIVQGNALRIDWQSLIDPLPFEKGEAKYDYILGNPPFSGAMIMNDGQRSDMKFVFENKINGYGVLDYVSAWYLKSAEYLQLNTNSECAFVSTSSITQGEQVGLLWGTLVNNYNIQIKFAHTTFKWNNEARGIAAVHCVIVGFGVKDFANKRIFKYDNIDGDPHEFPVGEINSYLVEGKQVFLPNRKDPICNVPKMSFGSMPRDGGHLLLTEDEKNSFLAREPGSEKWIKKYIGSQEFINGFVRYCLWLKDINPTELKLLPEVLKRVELVKKFRLESKAASTRKFAGTPTLFCQIAQPDANYIVMPGVSSERRKYIPLGFLTKDIIANNLVFTIPKANLYHFSVLTSIMHMVWVQSVCGRLESRFRYSKDIVYNNFPWPENPTDKQKDAVEKAAQAVLDARAQFPDSSLADLYDPNTMPPALVKAHQQLDKAVDLCYRPQPFPNETKRIEFLFELYDKYRAGLFVKEKKPKKKTK